MQYDIQNHVWVLASGDLQRAAKADARAMEQERDPAHVLKVTRRKRNRLQAALSSAEDTQARREQVQEIHRLENLIRALEAQQ